MPPSVAEIPDIGKKRGRKRKNAPKSPTKKRRREDEKENRLAVPSASSSSSSSSSSSTTSSSEGSRESSNPWIFSRRKCQKPMHLRDLPKTLETSDDPEELYNFQVDVHLDEFLFLPRNVVQKKKLEAKKIRVSRKSPFQLESSLARIERNLMERDSLIDLCTLDFTKVVSWGSLTEALNYKCSVALAQTFLVIVDLNGEVTILENGMSVVPLGEQAVLKNSNEKIVKITEQQMETAKLIYLAAIVYKNTAVKKGAENGKRRATRQVNNPDPNHEKDMVVETTTRFGCILMYEDGGIDNFDDGMQRIVLVDRDERAEYLSIFGFKFDRENIKKWMGNAENLRKLNQLTNVKEDSHISRLVFTTEKPEDPDEKFRCLPEKSPRRRSHPTTSSELPIPVKFAFDGEFSMETTTARSKTGNLRCPLTNWEFRNLRNHVDRLDVKFPCFQFQISPGENKILITPHRPFFVEPPPNPFQLFHFRQKLSRSLGDDYVVRFEQENPILSTRNRGVLGEPKFGLDFVQCEGHKPFISTVYKPRDFVVPYLPKKEAVVTLSDSEEEDDGEAERNDSKKEFYVHNNSQMYTAYLNFQRKLPILPDHMNNDGNEMKVMEMGVSERQIADFNEKLKETSTKGVRIKKRRKNQFEPDFSAQNLGLDRNGRPVPNFAELFFPRGKNELYNILARHYYSSAGHRPGCFSADWKSRILTGFIKRHYRDVFDEKLEAVFIKQVQLIAMTTSGWSADHFDLPMKALATFKKQWKMNKLTKKLKMTGAHK